MIPQRRLSRDGYGNGVSCRVEACRRRLRTVRANGTQGRFEDGAAQFAADDNDFNGVTSSNLDFGGAAEGKDEAGIT